MTDFTSASEPPIRKHVDLSPYNTLGLASVAETFINITSVDDLHVLARQNFFSNKNRFPFVLGGGSNVLLKGNLSVPVLKNDIRGIEVIRRETPYVWIEAGAGENWHNLVTWTVERGYAGIENLALIPGTAGAAPIQNIGAYGVELEEVFDSLRCFDMRTRTMKRYSREECRFGYRDSIFKHELKGKVIVTGIVLRLKTRDYSVNTSYHSLQHYLESHGVNKPSIRDVYDAVVAIRSSKLPDPDDLGNAGSFFKNPVVSADLAGKLKTEYPGLPTYPLQNGRVKIPAGWLIEQAGWKGKRVGNVATYENQALVLVNHGGATGEEVCKHAMRIRTSVKKMFGIELVPEVNIIE